MNILKRICKAVFSKKTLKNPNAWPFFLLLICFIIDCIKEKIEYYSLTEHPAATYAIVYDFIDLIGDHRFKYTFFVNGVKYEGNEHQYKDYDVLLGDTVYIVYDTTDPSNNRFIKFKR